MIDHESGNEKKVYEMESRNTAMRDSVKKTSGTNTYDISHIYIEVYLFLTVINIEIQNLNPYTKWSRVTLMWGI